MIDKFCTIWNARPKFHGGKLLGLLNCEMELQVGFCSDKRRLNVAITRARRHVCLICDTTTLSADPFLARLVKYFRSKGVVLQADLTRL